MGGGGVVPGGVPGLGGVPGTGVYLLLGGVPSPWGMYLLPGVTYLLPGVTAVVLPPLPREQNDWQTGVKT